MRVIPKPAHFTILRVVLIRVNITDLCVFDYRLESMDLIPRSRYSKLPQNSPREYKVKEVPLLQLIA